METTTKDGLAREIGRFRRDRNKAAAASQHRLTLQLNFGFDLEKLPQASPQQLRRLCLNMSRRLECERLKGFNGHWSYDLNRHVAMKMTLDYVRTLVDGPARLLPAV